MLDVCRYSRRRVMNKTSLSLSFLSFDTSAHTIDGHRRRRPTGRLLLLLLHSSQVGPWLSRCRSPPPPRRPGPSKRSPCHSGKTAACPAAPAPANEPLALLNGGGGAAGAADASHARGVPAVPAGRLTALFRNGGKRETRDRGGGVEQR